MIAPGEQVVAVDLGSTETRCQAWEPDVRQLLGPWGPAAGDPRRWRDSAQLEAALAAGGPVLVSGRSRDQRRELVVPVLRAAQRLRTWTGRPEWLIVSDVTELLGDPDVPPETLNLAEGGHILVMRNDVALQITPRLTDPSTRPSDAAIGFAIEEASLREVPLDVCYVRGADGIGPGWPPVSG